MIVHYVLFKYKEGFFSEEKLSEMKNVFDHVVRDVDGVEKYEIDKNVVDRPSNMDVMVTMYLRDETSLKSYISHPEHVEISNRYAPNITKICSFDKEIN
jgi:hypothetical protein